MGTDTGEKYFFAVKHVHERKKEKESSKKSSKTTGSNSVKNVN